MCLYTLISNSDILNILTCVQQDHFKQVCSMKIRQTRLNEQFFSTYQFYVVSSRNKVLKIVATILCVHVLVGKSSKTCKSAAKQQLISCKKQPILHIRFSDSMNSVLFGSFGVCHYHLNTPKRKDLKTIAACKNASSHY